MTGTTPLLVVDGYNVAHAWPETHALLEARGPLEDVRRVVVARLAAHAAVTQERVVVVFDAPRRAGAPPSPARRIDGVEVRFGGGEFGSADHLIERLVYEQTRDPDGPGARVATADRLVRDIVRAMGASTVDPLALLAEVGMSAAETQSRLDTMERGARFAHRVEDRVGEEVRAHLETLRGTSAAASSPEDAHRPAPPVPPPRVRERFRPFDPARDLGPGGGDKPAGGAP